MISYEEVRKQYKPNHIKLLFVAESPPPPPDVQSSRQFYYTDHIRKDDRLFTNTIRALFPETIETSEPELETHKHEWLMRLQRNGIYMIEALDESQEHAVTKKERQKRIRENLPRLIERVKRLAAKDTKIILIKSNVFEIAAKPLRKAGFHVLNTELVDYPGKFNQRDYREKLATLVNQI